MTDYGDGIITRKDVFTDNEKKTVLRAKAESERLEKIQNELTEISQSFDNAIMAVRNFSMHHKIKDVISKPIQIEIQKQRDEYINKVKEELLHPDS